MCRSIMKKDETNFFELPDSETPVRKAAVVYRFEDDPEISEIQARLTFTALWGVNPRIGRAGLIQMDGALKFEREAACARCLAKVRKPVITRFRTLFNLDETTTQAADLETPPEEGGFERVGETRIDVTQEIRQRVYLALEEIVYCRKDCKGLCSRCGADLNQGVCECDRGIGGGPFEALRGLLDGSESPT